MALIDDLARSIAELEDLLVSGDKRKLPPQTAVALRTMLVEKKQQFALETAKTRGAIGIQGAEARSQIGIAQLQAREGIRIGREQRKISAKLLDDVTTQFKSSAEPFAKGGSGQPTRAAMLASRESFLAAGGSPILARQIIIDAETRRRLETAKQQASLIEANKGKDRSRRALRRAGGESRIGRAQIVASQEKQLPGLGFAKDTPVPAVPGTTIKAGTLERALGSTRKFGRDVAGAKQRAVRIGGLKKFGLGAVGAAILLPLISKAFSGGAKQKEVDPAAQMQMLQLLGAGGGRGIAPVDPALAQGRELRNVLSLLNIIEKMRGFENVALQPTAGIV